VPIEFQCAQCGKTLRTPDDSAGKQAKCPECGSLTSVPVPQTTPDEGSAFTWTPGTPSQPQPPKPAIDPGNPYASSVSHPQEVGHGMYGGASGLQRGYLDFGHIIGTTWSAFSAQMGWGVLFALVVIGIVLVATLFVAPLAFVQQRLLINGNFLGGMGVVFAQQLIQLPINALTFCVSINFGLNVLRAKRAPFDGLFDIGHAYVPVMGYLLVFFGIWLVCFGPGQAVTMYNTAVGRDPGMALLGSMLTLIGAIVHLIIWLVYMLTPMLVLDRRMPMFEAMKASAGYMAGNKGMAFLILLVVGLLGFFFVLVTCLIGTLFIVPYYAILMAAMYLSATGQLSRGPAPGYGASPYA
jgi:phage FluMu protein Com